MHVDVVGTGRDLVLLHGWAMHGGIFAPLTRALADSHRVHLVDLPGHGASAAPVGALALADLARDVAAEVPRDSIWIGWSLGGLVALTAALAPAPSPRALALIAASPRFVVGPDWTCGVELAVFESFADGLRGDYRRTIERFLALEALGSAQAQQELRELRRIAFERGEPSRAALLDGLRILEETDLRAALPGLAMPSAWIGGRRDRLVPARALEWAAAQCRDGRYVELDSGHAPFIAHATAVADVVADLERRAP